MPFISPVRVNALCVIGGGRGNSPLRVRIYKDKDHFDFGDAESMQPTQVIELHENPTGDLIYAT